MVIKVYVSGISGNKEVKKRQQRVLLILDSKSVKYEEIDIAEPGAEEAKDFMQNNATSVGGTISDPSPRHPLPPQIFNDDDYCGDYDLFDLANEMDEMEKFLKIEVPNAAEELISNAEIKLKNGEVTPDEKETPKDEEIESAATPSEVKENEVPNEQETVESEEKSKEEAKETEEAKDAEEPKVNEESKENDESKEDEESKKDKTSDEAKENEDSNEEKTKVGGSGDGAGDEQTENEQESASKKDEEKADEE